MSCLLECIPLYNMFFFYFFFQAEDGIRDGRVTGVQTCALPILAPEYAPIQVKEIAGHLYTNNKLTRIPQLTTDTLEIHNLSGIIEYINDNFDKDRKSTRLNSSHPSISYAVFCLKKKTNKKQNNN